MIMDKLELLRKRHSVRTFSEESLSRELRNKLNAEATMTNTVMAGLRFQLFYDNDDPFKGFFKSYGTFKNAHNYLAAVANEGVEDIWEKAGYFAEKFVVRCVELGLGTCFVGGTYDPSSINAQLNAGEKILFVVVFGFPADYRRRAENLLVKFVHRKKLELKDFFIPSDKFEESCKLVPHLKEGCEAVACAPSAINKRPVRLFLKQEDGEDIVCAKVEVKNKLNLVDLGVAKFNYNFATDTECEFGNGAPLTIKE